MGVMSAIYSQLPSIPWYSAKVPERTAEEFNLSLVPNDIIVGELKRRLDCLRAPDKRVILLGPPGSGKGTQAEKIVRGHCMCHLATGDILRKAVESKTELGVKAKGAMLSGALVS
eukprot:CAMPEP_0196596618 /NCGR_PEP_ID=MMETSP1081-20130531/87020_1 /TAXON_ID=36882 /ORGANISM="Pyramimonas amylifera, Strain CCMP720" /LENGTH=114 /DNA_ID=CAMNT_0041921711 /DNA_START=22 /DNA_END=363 /DNA_ORIENTATION=-